MCLFNKVEKGLYEGREPRPAEIQDKMLNTYVKVIGYNGSPTNISVTKKGQVFHIQYDAWMDAPSTLVEGERCSGLTIRTLDKDLREALSKKLKEFRGIGKFTLKRRKIFPPKNA